MFFPTFNILPYLLLRSGLEAAASPAEAKLLGRHKFEDVEFNVTRGDYSPLMKAMADNLEKAQVRHKTREFFRY